MIRVTIGDDFGTTLEYYISTDPQNPNYHHWGAYNPIRDQWRMGRIFSESKGADLVWRTIHHSCNANHKQWNEGLIEDHLAFAS